MSEKKLFLLDGMALIYRAFFAFKDYPRITSYGLNTSAMFGFTNTLLEVIQKQTRSKFHKNNNLKADIYTVVTERKFKQH